MQMLQGVIKEKTRDDVNVMLGLLDHFPCLMLMLSKKKLYNMAVIQSSDFSQGRLKLSFRIRRWNKSLV